MDYYGEYKVNDYVVKDSLYKNPKDGKQINFNHIIHNEKLILISYVNKNEFLIYMNIK